MQATDAVTPITHAISNSNSRSSSIEIESCHSTWIFDQRRMRYRRVLRGTGTPLEVATAWRPYYGIETDDAGDTFAVLLNPAGTRILRSFRHPDGCAECGGDDGLRPATRLETRAADGQAAAGGSGRTTGTRGAA